MYLACTPSWQDCATRQPTTSKLSYQGSSPTELAEQLLTRGMQPPPPLQKYAARHPTAYLLLANGEGKEPRGCPLEKESTLHDSPLAMTLPPGSMKYNNQISTQRLAISSTPVPTNQSASGPGHAFVSVWSSDNHTWVICPEDHCPGGQGM
jgi:hypothetical protein